jgi:hypothetical protein
LFLQVISFGTVGEIEEAEAGEHVDICRFKADAFPQLGSTGQLAIELDDGGRIHARHPAIASSMSIWRATVIAAPATGGG